MKLRLVSNHCLKLAIVFALASTFTVALGQSNEGVESRVLSEKLDLLDEKLDRLNRHLLTSCGCPSDDSVRNETPTQSSPPNERSFTKRNAKEDSSTSGDVFHFNKLADNLNSIPASSSIQEQAQVEQAGQEGQSLEKRIIMTIGQHYESLFGNALDNLNLIMKEQLAGFRLTLNKLMNRLADHNYQHSVLANQLTLAKDECSLAVAYSSVSANLTSALVSDFAAGFAGANSSSSSSPTAKTRQQSEAGAASGSRTSGVSEQNTLRSSDIMMIVRLISEELNQLIQKSVASTATSPERAQGQRRQPETDEQERLLRLEASFGDLKMLQRRLDEVDSVVRQSANLLTKLSYNLAPGAAGQPLGLERYAAGARSAGGQLIAGSQGDKLAAATATTTLTYTNLNETGGGQSGTTGSINKTRWFSGSRVPNQRLLEPSEQQQQQQQQQHQQPLANATRPTCHQAKKILVRPTSCRQLREAGANCTGQYYVFVRGSIRHVFCDMNMDPADDGGGWTVILRRIDKSLSSPNLPQTQAPSAASKWLELLRAAQVDFNQDWANYKSGFGDNWSEFFVGLELLQQLVGRSDNANPPATNSSGRHELQLDLTTGAGHELHLKFDDFSIGDESQQFRFQVGGCNASEPAVCEPLLSCNSSKFYTHDKLMAEFCRPSAVNSSEASGQIESLADSKSALPGWWLSTDKWPPLLSANGTSNEQLDCRRQVEQFVTSGAANASLLTAPIGRRQQAPISHLHWPNWQHSDEPIVQLVLKVRPRRQQL